MSEDKIELMVASLIGYVAAVVGRDLKHGAHPDWTFLSKKFEEYLRAAASETTVVSDEEIKDLHDAWSETDASKTEWNRTAYVAGFREAERRRAVMELQKLWPSEEEARSETVHYGSHGQEGFMDGYRWLKEKLGVK